MNWEKYRLGDICNMEKGNIGIKKAITGDYPLVVLGEERRTHNEYQFDDEAVVIPLVSSTGHGHRSMKRIHYQCGKFSVGSILCAVIPKDKSMLSAKYLFRYLDLYKEEELVSRMKGMANVSLPMKSIAEVEIPVPPKYFQENIIKKFNSIEQSTNHLDSESTHQIYLLKKLRQQILQDAVEGKLVPQDPNDEPASKLLERIKAEKEQLIREKKIKKGKPLPKIKPEEIPFEIPANWVWCRLGDITNYGSSPKAEPSDINDETWVLDLEDIEKETSRLLCKIRFSERQSLSTKSVFKQGEVLYSKLRPYLDKVIVADEDGVCTTEILPLHCYSNLNPYYLRIALKRRDFLFYVNSVTKGMKMPRLGTSEGKSALIPVSPANEQHRIVTKTEQLMTLCDELEQSIKQNQKYTQDLLQVALKEALEPKVQ